MNNHWVDLYKTYVFFFFWADPKFKMATISGHTFNIGMATISGHTFNIGPFGKILENLAMN